MACPRDEDDEAELDEREWPDEADADDEPSLIDCPYCASPISEEAEVCPHCGSFINLEDTARRGRAWIWVAVAGVLAAVLLFSAM